MALRTKPLRRLREDFPGAAALKGTPRSSMPQSVRIFREVLLVTACPEAGKTTETPLSPCLEALPVRQRSERQGLRRLVEANESSTSAMVGGDVR